MPGILRCLKISKKPKSADQKNKQIQAKVIQNKNIIPILSGKTTSLGINVAHLKVAKATQITTKPNNLILLQTTCFLLISDNTIYSLFILRLFSEICN